MLIKSFMQPLNAAILKLLALSALLLFAGSTLAQSPQQKASAQAQSIKFAYYKEGTDFSKYHQYVLRPLDLGDTRLVPPPWEENPDPRRWRLSDENIGFLKAAYALAMKQGIEASGKFNVVKNPTPGTLQLEMRIVSLAPWAAKDEKVTTKGYGTLAFEAHLRDAMTGELLAVYEGEQEVGADYQENTDFNKASNLAMHFNNWGHNISQRLEAAHQEK